MGVLDRFAGYYRDIEVAKESKAGEASPDVRPESIPDQTSVGRTDVNGPPSPTFNVGGVPLDGRVLAFTGLAIGGLVAIRLLK